MWNDNGIAANRIEYVNPCERVKYSYTMLFAIVYSIQSDRFRLSIQSSLFSNKHTVQALVTEKKTLKKNTMRK